MSDEIKEPGGSLEESGGQNQESAAQDSVAGGAADKVDYLTYKKVMDELKRAKASGQESREEAERLRQERLEQEGKLSELVDSLKAENQKLKNETRKVVGNFAYKSVRSQLEAEAAKVGCLNPNALAKLVDLDSFDVDTETFSASQDQLKVAIDSVRKEVPGLFAKASPNVNNSNPKIGAEPSKGGLKKLNEMSEEELVKAWEKRF